MIPYLDFVSQLFIIAAVVACSSGYYNHGPAVNPAWNYGNYGNVAALPVSGHHGTAYGSGYGNYGVGAGHTKIIEATYPGAVHKSANYAVTNPTGQIGAEYSHGSVNHAVAPAAAYVHGPSPVVVHDSPISYNHGPIAVAAHAPIAYDHRPVAVAAHAPIAYNHAPAATYAHSRYAVTEGPGTYSAHSRYSIAGAPALSYQHPRYPIAVAPGSAYVNALSAGHGVQKIAYDQAVSHMGYQSHAAQSYAW